jgi:nicotinamidase-related amidase
MAGRKAGLAVIDVQEDFCEPSGSLAVSGGRALAPIWNDLLSYPFAVKLATRDFHPADHISFASQHEGKQPFTDSHTIPNPENADDKAFTTLLWPDHCIQSTKGCEFIPELDVSKTTQTIEKGQDKRVESYSAFGPVYRNPPVGMSGLGDSLKEAGVTDLFVVGLAYDYCVKHTAIDAVEHGFKTFVIEDATKAVDQSEEGLAKTRKELEDSGVVIIGLDSKELDAVKGQ